MMNCGMFNLSAFELNQFILIWFICCSFGGFQNHTRLEVLGLNQALEMMENSQRTKWFNNKVIKSYLNSLFQAMVNGLVYNSVSYDDDDSIDVFDMLDKPNRHLYRDNYKLAAYVLRLQDTVREAKTPESQSNVSELLKKVPREIRKHHKDD